MTTNRTGRNRGNDSVTDQSSSTLPTASSKVHSHSTGGGGGGRKGAGLEERPHAKIKSLSDIIASSPRVPSSRGAVAGRPCLENSLWQRVEFLCSTWRREEADGDDLFEPPLRQRPLASDDASFLDQFLSSLVNEDICCAHVVAGDAPLVLSQKTLLHNDSQTALSLSDSPEFKGEIEEDDDELRATPGEGDLKTSHSPMSFIGAETYLSSIFSFLDLEDEDDDYDYDHDDDYETETTDSSVSTDVNSSYEPAIAKPNVEVVFTPPAKKRRDNRNNNYSKKNTNKNKALDQSVIPPRSRSSAAF